MTGPTDIEEAALALTNAMANLVRAIDAVGDDAEACQHVPVKVPEELERLVARVSAAQGFTD